METLRPHRSALLRLSSMPQLDVEHLAILHEQYLFMGCLHQSKFLLGQKLPNVNSDLSI